VHKRVAFLDFDGVINSNRTIFSASNGGDRARPRKAMAKLIENLPPYPGGVNVPQLARELSHLAPGLIKKLSVLTEHPEVSVVVSSAWRVLHTNDQLRWFLEARGFRGTIIDQTPRAYEIPGADNTARRGDEIQHWLDLNPTEHFTIVDDGCDMKHLMHKLVRTDPEVGITAGNVREMRKMLFP